MVAMDRPPFEDPVERGCSQISIEMLRIQGDAHLLRALLSHASAQVSAAVEKSSQIRGLIENDLQYRQDPCTVAINSQSR